MFDKQYISNPNHKNDLLHPVVAKTSVHRAMDILTEYVKNKKYENISVNKDYYEIYGMDENFEITFILINNQDGSTLIRILAYTDAALGGAKRKIKEITSELKDLFR